MCPATLKYLTRPYSVYMILCLSQLAVGMKWRQDASVYRA